MCPQRFDLKNKGRYVAISAGGTVARRQSGFCDGLAVSEAHIRPGELVLVEILETQPGWSGDLRIGFTLLPDQLLQPLPSFAIPELVSRGQSWIFPVGTAAAFLVSHRHRSYWRRQQKMRRSIRQLDSVTANDASNTNEPDTEFTFGASNVPSFMPDYSPVQPNPKASCMCCLNTGFGRVAFSRLMPIEASLARPPDVEKGSVVGIYYELEPLTSSDFDTTTPSFNWDAYPDFVPAETSLTDQPVELPSYSKSPEPEHAMMFCRFRFHIVINGIDLLMLVEQLCVRPDQLYQGEPSSEQRQLNSPASSVLRYPKFRAVFDVYGQTKAIQLLPVNQNPVASLRRLCSCVILRCILRSQYFDWLEEPHKGLKPAKVFKSTGDADSRVKELLFTDHFTSRSSAENVRTQHVFAALQTLPLPRSDRHRLHLDACAVLAREHQGMLTDS